MDMKRDILRSALVDKVDEFLEEIGRNVNCIVQIKNIRIIEGVVNVLKENYSDDKYTVEQIKKVFEENNIII